MLMLCPDAHALAHHCKHCDHQESKERAATPNQTSTPTEEKVELKVCAVGITPADCTTTIDMGQYSDIRQEQMQDSDLKPILEWKEKSNERPKWSEMSSCSPITKHYTGHNGRA